MKVDKVNLSTVLDDELTDRDCGNITIPGAADVVNGSGNGARNCYKFKIFLSSSTA